MVSITIAKKSGAKALAKRIAGMTSHAAYVGVPSTSTAARSEQLTRMANQGSSKKHKKLANKAAQNDINNAELLFIHTMGSPIRHIPPRPVLQPAVEFADNMAKINNELMLSMQARLRANPEEAVRRMKRAALAGQNAARGWFTNPNNHWAPNAPSTVARKGSDRPLIDTGALRAAIVGLVREED